jgi:hypothetical protein
LFLIVGILCLRVDEAIRHRNRFGADVVPKR